MRIISGKHRGRRIEAPKGMEVRPTTDRCREALFNLLMHGHFEESPIIGQSVLDLCCGTGALGLEALSRGAAHATFVDNSKRSLDCTRDNVAALGETGNARFILSDVQHLPSSDKPVSSVLMDAPYHSGLIAPAYQALVKRGWLRNSAVLAFEHSTKDPFPELTGCEHITQRDYGKTNVTIVQFSGG